MNDREKINRFRGSLKNLKEAHDKAKGGLEAHMKQLKDKFNITSVSKAKEQIADWETERKKIEKEIEKKTLIFEKKYNV